MQGHIVRKSLDANEENWRHSSAIFLDSFYRLAEAVGARRMLSAEHGQTTNMDGDVDAIFEDIENAVGADLTPPRMNGGLFGLRLRRGIVDDRHCAAIYAAWRMRQLISDRNQKTWRVVEFGGGGGHLAYYATILGAQSYTIVDLPVTSFVQYLMLSESFGEDETALGTNSEARINLVDPQTAEDLEGEQFDIAVTMDSLPESRAQLRGAMLDWQRRLGYFLA